MKRYRYIRAASDIETEFDSLIDDAGRVGYKMKVSGDVPKVMLTSSDRQLPRIFVETIDEGSGKYTFQARLTFPEINTEDLGMDDATETLITDKWADVGWFITQLKKFVYESESE